MGWRDKREAIKEVSESAATYDREAAKEFLNVPKLYHLEIGVDSPAIVNAIVECPKGSSNKYKFCKEVGQLKLDRVFHSSAFYPGPCLCGCVCVCGCDGALARNLSAHHSGQGGDRIRQLNSLASYPSPRTPQTPQPGMEPEPTATVLTVPQ